MSLFQISRMCLWYSESPLQLLIFPGGAKIIFWQKILVVNFTFVKKNTPANCYADPPEENWEVLNFQLLKPPAKEGNWNAIKFAWLRHPDNVEFAWLLLTGLKIFQIWLLAFHNVGQFDLIPQNVHPLKFTQQSIGTRQIFARYTCNQSMACSRVQNSNIKVVKCLPESLVVSGFLKTEGNLCLLGGNCLTWRW